MASTSPETLVAHPIAAPEVSPATEKIAGAAATNVQAKKHPPKIVRVPPPGYKFVRLPRPDGTFCTVQRPLSPEDLAAQEAKKKKNEASKSVATQKSDITSKVSTSPKTTTPTKDTSTTSPRSPSAIHESSLNSPDDKAKKSQGAADSAEAPMSPGKLKGALEEQAIRNREKRYRRFKRSIFGGLASVVGYAMPTIEIGDEFQDGDTIVNHVDDPSDDDDFGMDQDQSGSQQHEDIGENGDINSLEHHCKSCFVAHVYEASSD
jgi:hypothetical protein